MMVKYLTSLILLKCKLNCNEILLSTFQNIFSKKKNRISTACNADGNVKYFRYFGKQLAHSYKMKYTSPTPTSLP